MYIPSTFTEWLLQEGLIRNEQYCQLHVNHDLTPVKFKLGIYRDVSKFPYSGGYIWIPPCCTSQVVSVRCSHMLDLTYLLCCLIHFSTD